ncbi:MAG: hypothetical protein IJ785_02985 [Bacteroidales bacterium]|nr:hypothetical protein [Bacteroidales bacterium]
MEIKQEIYQVDVMSRQGGMLGCRYSRPTGGNPYEPGKHGTKGRMP